MLGLTCAEVGPALVTAGKLDGRATRDPAHVEERDRKRVPDAHQVREIHQRPDGRQLALLRQASQECLGRRAVLRRIDAEAAEHLSPGRQRVQLADGRLADARADRECVVVESCGESRRRRGVVDAGCVDDAADDRREALDDVGVLAEARHGSGDLAFRQPWRFQPVA